MKLYTFNFLSLLFIMALSACHSQQENASAAVFNQFSPASKEYRNELAKLLQQNSEDLTYTFQKYVSENEQEYLAVQFAGEGFEADGLVLVKDWKKLDGIKATKGMGYAGAELQGLQLEIVESAAGASLVYKDLERIID